MKRFRMFAGPNGSGKSTFIQAVKEKCWIGYYINADDIEKLLSENEGKLDYSKYVPHEVNQEDWFTFVELQKKGRLLGIDVEALRITANILDISGAKLDSYLAAIIAEFFRFELLKSNKSFSFETVMSHISKVEFLHKAKQSGFKTYLYFICTSDPEINKNRVNIRVTKGGHGVEESKIEKRYFNSLGLLKDAFLAVDRAYIFDSSEENIKQTILFEKKEGEIVYHTDVFPGWILEYLIDHLEYSED